jgi:hypothetical protein
MRRDTLTAFAEAGRGRPSSGSGSTGWSCTTEVDWLARRACAGRRSDRLAAEAVEDLVRRRDEQPDRGDPRHLPRPPYGSGILFFGRGELTEMVRDLDAQGFQVCIHSQGDRAIETVLDAYATVLAGAPGNRAGTGSSTAARCTRHDRAGPRSWGSWWRASPGSSHTLGDGFAEAFPDSSDQLYPSRPGCARA